MAFLSKLMNIAFATITELIQFLIKRKHCRYYSKLITLIANCLNAGRFVCCILR